MGRLTLAHLRRSSTARTLHKTRCSLHTFTSYVRMLHRTGLQKEFVDQSDRHTRKTSASLCRLSFLLCISNFNTDLRETCVKPQLPMRGKHREVRLYNR